MAFRKRNIGISRVTGNDAPHVASCKAAGNAPRGSRPSPVDGRLTTSTGTPSLDTLLAGHAGLALGSSMLIEENGTTDSAGTLLRYYAAEGIVQGHRVHVIGVGEHWTKDLPGVVGAALDSEETTTAQKEEQDKMKIAWRYEKLGKFEGQSNSINRGPSIQRGPAPSTIEESTGQHDPFCHVFDLTKRLSAPLTASQLQFLSPDPRPLSLPFANIIQGLEVDLAASPIDMLHRLVVPSLLSPAIYPPHAAEPQHLVAFFHAIRGLLRRYSTKLTALITVPLELYNRAGSLMRWAELLSDGVLELTPFPHQTDDSLTQAGAATAHEERPQGMFKIHKLPVFHERGGGGGGLKGLGNDFAYTVSRRRFAIKPFSLPPAEGDAEAQQAQKKDGPQAMPSKEQMEF